MKPKQQTVAWIRLLQGLGLFFALVIVLPWLGGKIVPGRGTESPPAPQARPAAGPAHNNPPAQPQQAGAPPSAAPQQQVALAMEPYHPFTPEELQRLPQWQQVLLNDAGWIQPYTLPAAQAPAGSNELHASISATLPRLPGGQAYEAQAGHMNDGLGCLVRLRVSLSGGQPDAQARYKYCNWTFGDGLSAVDQTAFTDDTLELNHFYAGAQQQERRYIARVQVVDAAGAVAFADSLPIVVQ